MQVEKWQTALKYLLRFYFYNTKIYQKLNSYGVKVLVQNKITTFELQLTNLFSWPNPKLTKETFWDYWNEVYDTPHVTQ